MKVLIICFFVLYISFASCSIWPFSFLSSSLSPSSSLDHSEPPELCLWDNCGFCQDGNPYANDNLTSSDFLVYNPGVGGTPGCYGPGTISNSSLPPPLSCISGVCPAEDDSFLVGSGGLYVAENLTTVQDILGIGCLDGLCAAATNNSIPVFDPATGDFVPETPDEVLDTLGIGCLSDSCVNVTDGDILVFDSTLNVYVPTPASTLLQIFPYNAPLLGSLSSPTGSVLSIDNQTTTGMVFVNPIPLFNSVSFVVSALLTMAASPDNQLDANLILTLDPTWTASPSLWVGKSVCTGTVINAAGSVNSTSSTPVNAQLTSSAGGFVTWDGLPILPSLPQNETSTISLFLSCGYVSSLL